MSKTYRVAIAGSDRSDLDILRDLLTRMDHRVVAKADSLESLFQSSVVNDLELLICDIGHSFDHLNESMERLHYIPVIIASNSVDAAYLESKVAHHVFGVLLRPLREVELAAMIVVASERFHEFSQLRDEAVTLRAALEDRKVIERAKGVIMRRCGLDESSAFSRLQHLARQHRQKLIDIAKGICRRNCLRSCSNRVKDTARNCAKKHVGLKFLMQRDCAHSSGSNFKEIFVTDAF